MTKKQMAFDIDLPEGDGFPAGKVEGPLARCGPMAPAIAENAGSLCDGDETLAQIRAENDALAHEHVRMKRLGLITDLVPLDRIETYKLARDRAKGDDIELSELIASIRDVGLSNPIRVEPRADGQYELIQGYRRLSAYRALLAETGDIEGWGSIPAGILPQGETVASLYRRMVDENLVRKDISFAEMAMVALNYARDPAIAETDADRAVAQLFQSVGYQKRSYIRGFIRVMDRLGDNLRFAQHIPRALGLRLSAELEERPEAGTLIRAALAGFENRSVSDEINILRDAMGIAAGQGEDAPLPARRMTPASGGTAKTTFQMASRFGAVRCAAANGRLEIRLGCDFTTLDRKRLETAVRNMLDQLA